MSFTIGAHFAISARITAANWSGVSIGSSPEEFAQFLKEDLRKYAEIAKKAGIQPQ